MFVCVFLGLCLFPPTSFLSVSSPPFPLTDLAKYATRPFFFSLSWRDSGVSQFFVLFFTTCELFSD